jgi:hypothetical protein
MKRTFSVLLFTFFALSACLAQTYSLPSDRTITWNPAGMDVVGGIPSGTWSNCVTTQCNTVSGGTVTAASINAAITSAPANTVVNLPAGPWAISGNINMKSNVVLRGAKPAASPWMPTADSSATQLNLSSGSKIEFVGGSKAANWTPGATSGYAITSGYTQGSTALTLSSGDAANFTGAGTEYISVYQNTDSALISYNGATWLGEDCDCAESHAWQQYARVVSKNGTILTIEPPVYGITPTPTGPAVRKQTFGVVNAGLENMRVNSAGGAVHGIIEFIFTRNCWLDNIETYNADNNSSGSAHVWTQFSYANEYRDSYLHHGVSNNSGRNYGFEFYHWNSRHKIENNIVRDTRHSIANEGGNSGTVFLYNYTDQNWEGEDYSDFLTEDEAGNHGAHPKFNLFEGNNATDYWFDYTQGSSSHNTVFRNRVRCDDEGGGVGPSLSVNRSWTSAWEWSCVEIEYYNRYYNIVGNIIGLPSMTTGALIWNQAGSPSNWPAIFRFGFSSAGGSWTDGLSRSTAILHGNYDYVSDSQATWDGGSTHALADSLYYGSKPAFFGTCTWPPIDPSGPTTNTIPARERYNNSTLCTANPPSQFSASPTAACNISPSVSVTPLFVGRSTIVVCPH